MAEATVVETRRAGLSIVEAALPGQAAVPVGVIVHDPETGEWRARFRRDWESFGEEGETLAAVAAGFIEELEERGAAAWLRHCEDSLSHALRISDPEQVLAGDLDQALKTWYGKLVRPKVLPFSTHLPLYSARVAAGMFLDDNEVTAEDWIETPESLALDPRMFVARISGRSMEPRIPDGSLCAFRAGVSGSRQGKLLLIERRDVSESGGRYTVKRYHSGKRLDGEEWRHETIRLEPLNPEFEAWELEDDPDRFRVIGEFVSVLP